MLSLIQQVTLTYVILKPVSCSHLWCVDAAVTNEDNGKICTQKKSLYGSLSPDFYSLTYGMIWKSTSTSGTQCGENAHHTQTMKQEKNHS